MPIKLPKGFQRRKSSGNALDEINNPPASSFRVIERPANEKNFDGSLTTRSAGPGPPPSLRPRNSFDNDGEDMFSVARPDASNRYGKHSADSEVADSANVNRGSGGTENSVSTGHYNSAASSTRLSTSTNPSSIDSRSDRNVQTFKDIPVPPPPSARPGFLRNSARTFSLGIGIKSAKDAQTATPEKPSAAVIHPSNESTRSRAMTASSASTATPPKLFDSDLALDASELDGFGNMFDGIGNRSSRDTSPVTRTHHINFPSSPPTQYPPTSFPGATPLRATRAPAPRPIMTNRNDAIESSPYSLNSQDSRDGLMRSPSPSRTITQHSPSRPFTVPALGSPSNPAARALPQGRKPVPYTQVNSIYADVPPAVPTHTTANSTSRHRPTVSNTSDASQNDIDPALAASAELASRFQEKRLSAPRPAPHNKIMTPAQFELYKRQQEMDRRLGPLADSDSEDADNYDDDDDDAEKEKQATKQRKKQEAHLSVYRQQMMKVTGDPSAARSTSNLGNPPRTSSTTELDNRLSHLTVSTKQSSKSSGGEEEEDEDVPLGILAAHGFPNKNRPPTQLSQSTSNPNLRVVAQPQGGAGSVIEDIAKRGSLPVFAKNLPQDPYYGAGLVNQTHRESMSMHGGHAAPMAGSVASTAHPHHPAGLVGVIAGEEKARAMRRGSPNTQGGYDLPPSMQHPGMTRSSTTGMIPGPSGMMPGMLSPGDQAQIQMSQQMNQMMQMQMQWMQQMQQMMGGQMNGGQSMPPMPPQMMPQGMPPNFLAPPGQMSRPQSLQMNSAPAPGQRTMSTLTPSMANWNDASNNNYAHSIAPSERSNIGLAPRYRPVSTIQDPEISFRRASTFTSTSVRPWSQPELSPRPPAHGIKPSISPVGRKSPLAHHDEDDDEEGWAEMKAKKDKKQKSWKLRKGQNALQELYNGVS